MFKLGTKSRSNLVGVHPDLIKVVERAIQLTPIDFTVGQGLRTTAEQLENVKKGVSKTMDSRHLTGHAVDLWPLVNGKVTWDWQYYYPMAAAMKKAAAELNIPITWGGDWTSIKDGPHFELPKSQYPV